MQHLKVANLKVGELKEEFYAFKAILNLLKTLCKKFYFSLYGEEEK